MTEVIVAGLVLASWIFCYWLGWTDANEHRDALDAIDRLCTLACCGIERERHAPSCQAQLANAVSAVPSKNADENE